MSLDGVGHEGHWISRRLERLNDSVQILQKDIIRMKIVFCFEK
jgi:hypothetical protein